MEFALGVVPSAALDAGVVTFSMEASAASTSSASDVVDLDVSDEAGSFGTLSFSRTTHLPLKVTVRTTSSLSGTVAVAYEFRDYRSVSGLTLPFTIVRDDGRWRITLERYVVNGEVSPSLFAEPATDKDLARIVGSIR